MSKSPVASFHLLRTRAIGMFEDGKRHRDVSKALKKTTRTTNNSGLGLEEKKRSARPEENGKNMIFKYIGKRHQSTRKL